MHILCSKSAHFQFYFQMPNSNWLTAIFWAITERSLGSKNADLRQLGLFQLIHCCTLGFAPYTETSTKTSHSVFLEFGVFVGFASFFAAAVTITDRLGSTNANLPPFRLLNLQWWCTLGFEHLFDHRTKKKSLWKEPQQLLSKIETFSHFLHIFESFISWLDTLFSRKKMESYKVTTN